MSRTQDQIRTEIKAIQQRFNEGKITDAGRVAAIDASVNGYDSVPTYQSIAQAQNPIEAFGRGVVGGVVRMSPQALIAGGLNKLGAKTLAKPFSAVGEVNRTPFSSQYGGNPLAFKAGSYVGETIGSTPYALGGASFSKFKGRPPVRQQAPAPLPPPVNPNMAARASMNERYTLSDYSDYLLKDYKPKNANDTNKLIRDARQTAQKIGIDIYSGSPLDVRDRIADYLELYDTTRGL